MRNLTFIAEYRGGTYISQIKGCELNEALIIWCEKLDRKIFSSSKKQQIFKEILDRNNNPTPLIGIDHVWCCCFLSGKFFLLLNIVETI